MKLQHRMPVSASALALAVASSVSIAQAQSQTSENTAQVNSENQTQTSAQVRPLSEWNYDQVYEQGRFLGDRLLEADVIGENGDDIGDVVNAVLDEQNQIIALIAEVGGFWDIGDTHVIVPWDQVELSEEGVQVPVNEDNVEDYELYGENSAVTREDFQQKAAVDEDVETGERTWKLTELLNDYSNLQNGMEYGYVDNTVFSEQGELLAVIVMPSGPTFGGGGGAIAYPFHGYTYGWNPGYSSYALPYTQEDVTGMTTFNYDEFNGYWEDS
ncbi:PRC-barrel domain-containing protein [Halomonas sp. WWR20]